MSDMIERVARAQAGARWDSSDEEFRCAARELARFAIEAMRDPTKEMMNTTDVYMTDGADPDFLNIWQKMIDAALKPQPINA